MQVVNFLSFFKFQREFTFCSSPKKVVKGVICEELLPVVKHHTPRTLLPDLVHLMTQGAQLARESDTVKMSQLDDAQWTTFTYTESKMLMQLVINLT